MTVDLEVLHTDNHVLACVKPAGMVCVPDSGGDESLLDRARAWVGEHYAKPGAVFLGVVQRLDRPVSGVVVFGRTSKGAARLAEQFRDGRARKRYLGVVIGRPQGEEGEVEQWLVKDAGRNRVERLSAERAGARLARTRWRALRPLGAHTLLELEPLTGRPHQLRVACASLGAPLLGDVKYGAPEGLADRSIALHARSIEVDHPTRDERLRFEAAPPSQPWWSA
ncbi:MAG: RluA family pseudouridine synthase [Planctomycetota bacterium]|nr:RluA family pseudouridine synthase [Planctomycetota bacterium]MDP6763297.1 RluA family pseudouridine synthase [Planctomycetota bacterium]MDP6987975.1 RluA family pseudouridine synthase [Planctomycetota bacterium]